MGCDCYSLNSSTGSCPRHPHVRVINVVWSLNRRRVCFLIKWLTLWHVVGTIHCLGLIYIHVLHLGQIVGACDSSFGQTFVGEKLVWPSKIMCQQLSLSQDKKVSYIHLLNGCEREVWPADEVAHCTFCDIMVTSLPVTTHTYSHYQGVIMSYLKCVCYCLWASDRHNKCKDRLGN